MHASLLLAVKGALIQERGSRLPVTINVSWDHIDLKKAIFDRFKRYNATVKKLELSDVKLVYKSGEMVRFIPGTNIPFTVKVYKEDLGVSYHAIVLYLLPYEDLMKLMMNMLTCLQVFCKYTFTFLLDKYV